MKKLITSIALVAFTSLFIIGCAESSPEAGVATYDGSRFMLPAEPDGGQNVIAVRETSKDGDEVVMVGRIGGSLNPWVDDRVHFRLLIRRCWHAAMKKKKANRAAAKHPGIIVAKPTNCPVQWHWSSLLRATVPSSNRMREKCLD